MWFSLYEKLVDLDFSHISVHLKSLVGTKRNFSKRTICMQLNFHFLFAHINFPISLILTFTFLSVTLSFTFKWTFDYFSKMRFLISSLTLILTFTFHSLILTFSQTNNLFEMFSDESLHLKQMASCFSLDRGLYYFQKNSFF